MSQIKPVGIFLSDFHIGENLGGVSREQGPGYDEPVKGVFVRQEFQRFLDQLKETYGVSPSNRIPYLILLGDIWDLAVQPMDYTSELSIAFFNQAALQDYFEAIVYVSGNHDHHLWRMYQAKICEVDPLNDASQIEAFPQEIPGILDCTEATPSLYINNRKNPAADSFIQGLTGKSDIPVHVVYPNLYIRTQSDSGTRSMLSTHGHLFDPGWNLVTDYLPKTLKEMSPAPIGLATLEMLNSPVTEFWNYSLAQMGSYNFIEPIYDGLLKSRVAPVFDTLTGEMMGDVKSGLQAMYADQGWSWNWSSDEEKLFIKGILLLYKKIQAGVVEKIKSEAVSGAVPHPRYDESFLTDNQSRVASYFNMSHAAYASECEALGVSPDAFSSMVFGHTHVPLPATASGNPWNFPTAAVTGSSLAPNSVSIFNTGGWVNIGAGHSPMPMALFDDGNVTPMDICGKT